ncbi:hypothetical protein [Emticicia sp. BO119]|uniref:hypothetical protein n=1 Tax=Emticicia sp. BO119 TaxID=2757768 RepID=UPI0015F07DB9|nr:hypothetical protein [Emticicia sp. BO119]MBA4851359.1 hypothetical protein [Emticicia sp. BO119]
MATSKPEFQNYVYQNGTLFCALYKRRVVDLNGTATTQWYWLPTNKSGDIIDFRANALNGTFSSEANALNPITGIPPGYGTLIADRWQSDKYISYMNLYPFMDLGQFRAGVSRMILAGVNNILIPVLWSDVFDSYNSTGKRQDQNLNSSYEAKQNLAVDWVATTYPNVKISLLPMLYMDWVRSNDFWGELNNEKDNWGNFIRLGYNNTHPSLADKNPGSGRSMMKDFFQKLVNYYANRLGSKLNYVIPVITEQAEYGFNYDNGLSAHKAITGYSTATINAFQYWLFASANPNKYASLSALSNAWGIAYDNTSQITPPNTSLPEGTYDVAGMNTIFASRRGIDWYLFRESMLYDFAYDCKECVVSANNTYGTNIKFVLSFGGVSPNDELVPLRGSYDVLKWGEISDGLKTAFGSDNRFENTSLTLDYVQNYPNKIMTELHHIDYWGDSANPLPIDTVESNMLQSGRDAIINGAKDLLFIGGPYQGTWFDMLERLLKTLKPDFLKDNEGARARILNGAANISLSELLYSGNINGGISKWIGGNGRRDNRITLNFSNTTTFAGDADYPVTFQVKDNQMYYLRQSDIKNSVYGFRSLQDEEQGRPYTSLQQTYNATRVPILLTAFGITYPAGTKTRSIIEIVDQAGIKWLKMVQSRGVNTNENGVDYSNNHPEYRFLNNPNLSEDCRFWLPVKDGSGNFVTSYYDITITVFEAACRFDVYHADKDAPGGIAYNPDKSTTATGTSETIRVYTSQLTQANINQRVIKINNNRWP